MQLSLCLLSLLAATPLNVDRFLKDVPGVTSQPTAPAITKVDGVPVLQRSVSSSRSPEELEKHFIQVFDQAGLYMAPEQVDVKPLVGKQVSGLDTENLLSFSAILQPSGKGTTIVLAVVDMGGKKTTREQIGPVMPGATNLTTFVLENQKAMSYAVEATPAEIKGFYRDTLAQAGFKEAAPNVYQRGNEQFVLTVSPGVTERYVLLKLDTVPGIMPAAPVPTLKK